MSKTHEVTIRVGFFTYRAEVPDPRDPDKTVLRNRVANQGETIEVNEADYQRGLRNDAFGDPNEVEEVDGPDGGFPGVAEVSDDELVEYLSEANLNAADTVALAEGDAENARRLIAAEEEIAADEGEEPRKSVVEPLQKVADGDN
jgi:hypothetical protein